MIGLKLFAASVIALPWLNPFALGPSVSAVSNISAWLCTLAFALTCVQVENRSHQRVNLPATIAFGWLAAAFASCLIGLCQYFGLSSTFSAWVSQTDPGEAFANLRQRNQFATLINLSFAALFCFAMRHKLNEKTWYLVSALLVACFFAGGNAASGSRTGLFQFACICMIALWWGTWRIKAARWVLVVGVLGYGVATVLLPISAGLDPTTHGALARLQAGDAPCASRLTLWSNVFDLIAQKPLLGWGWGNLDYAHYITLYPGERFCDILDNAHNLPLHLAVELGVPFAVLFCGLVIWRIVRLKPWAETDRTRQLAWTVLMVIGLHSLVEYPLWYGPFQMTVGLCIWMLWRRPGLEGAGEAVAADFKPKRPLAQRLIAQAAIVLIAFLGVVAWDYWRVSQIYLPPESRAASFRDDTLAKSSETWFFKDTARFAQLSLMPLTQNNAQQVYDLASGLLHYSPEARVVEKLIESATMLGRLDEAVFHLARFRAAFPQDYEAWRVKTGVAGS